MRKRFAILAGAGAAAAAYVIWIRLRGLGRAATVGRAAASYPTVGQEILAALSIAGNLLLSPLTARGYRRWGATEEELARALPGDDLVPTPKLQSTRAITIRAPAAQVWPWLVQLGQERGGLYTFHRLENLAGCKIRNADRIVPEFQDVAVGDRVSLGPEGYPYFVVREILPGEAIVLAADSEGAGPSVSWVFYLDATGAHLTRLIVRYGLDYEPTWPNLMVWRVVTEPVAFVMERGMLKGIKQRTEALAAGSGRSARE